MTEFEKILKEYEFEIKPTFVSKINRDGWDCFHWTCRIILGANKSPNKVLEIPYYMGVGHVRKTKRGMPGQPLPLPPKVADVVYSLVMDASCGAMTFYDFCDELGYNNDSIKHLDIYLECQKTNRKVIDFLGNQLYTKLADAGDH